MKTHNHYILRFAFVLAISAGNVLTSNLYSQNVAINDDGASPDPKAMLDIKSTTKGFLMPRMTQAQRGSITSPTNGLIIYQTDNTPGFYYYNGSAWLPLFDASKGWGLTGNSGTAVGTNFIGTTDAVDFVVRTNNTEKIRVLTTGNVGIGVSNPTFKLHVNGKIKSNGINESSDFRYKKDIVRIDSALEKVLSLQGVMYNWKRTDFPELFTDSTLQMGLIAQEVEKVIPEVVETDLDGYKSVEYSHLVALLIEAIKEQEKEIDQLKAELASKEDLEELKKEVAALKSYLSVEVRK